MSHERIETNTGLLAILILVVISIGGLVEIVPLVFLKETTAPVEGLKPYNALEFAGRDVYVREGCYVCHSQMIRPFRAETERYGHYSVAGEFVYDHPFQWGSKRTGPDLARVGGRYSDEWHRVHLINPRDVVPESNMPGFPWLAETPLDADDLVRRMRVVDTLVGATCNGCERYTDEQLAAVPQQVEGKTEMDAMVAYLQWLGTAIKSKR